MTAIEHLKNGQVDTELGGKAIITLQTREVLSDSKCSESSSGVQPLSN